MTVHHGQIVTVQPHDGPRFTARVVRSDDRHVLVQDLTSTRRFQTVFHFEIVEVLR